MPRGMISELSPGLRERPLDGSVRRPCSKRSITILDPDRLRELTTA
ncbi:MAG: hypothetical protein GY929_24580 [Actinomycetia bacterium]|nr:hypothetical protein [Actinomycetes bacterium]